MRKKIYMIGHLNAETIQKLASPSNLRYGQAIFKRQGVELVRQETNFVEGMVGGLDGSMAEGGGQRRRTQIASSPAGLVWHCAGNPKDHQIFCKHCVALALFIQAEGSHA